MSEHECCFSCRFYCTSAEKDMGECRRSAPSINGWPKAFDDGWCGDWEKQQVPEATPDE